MATKKATTKVAEVKEVKEVKVEAPVVEAKVEVKEEVKAEAKKAPAKKATAKKEVKANVVLQFAGQEANMDAVVENAKNAFVAEGHKASEIKDIQIYVKPEDNAAYYVINQDITGKVNLF